MEKILGKADIEGKAHYQVQWKGDAEGAPGDVTWEPAENLDNVGWMVEEFENLISAGGKISFF